MPYVSLTTNANISDAKAEGLLKELSAVVAAGSGKPEQYVQVAVSGGVNMYMAKSDAPAAYLDVKAVGLPEAVAKSLSGLLCGLVDRELGIPPDRVYISFASFAGSMWGFNSGTF